jgi:hypothetical protein
LRDIGDASEIDNTSQPSLSILSFSHPPPTPTFLAQAVFVSDNQIIATGYEYAADGRLLGVKYCYNRPVALWELIIPHGIDTTTSAESVIACSAIKFTPSHLSSRSPRVDQHGSIVVWVSNKTGGPHASCVSLHSLNTHSKETRTLVDTVWEPGPGQFPGLYTDYGLPSSPFLQLSSVLLISCLDRSVRDLTPDEDGQLYSWTVLGTDMQDQVVCVRSSLTTPHEVVLGRFNDSGSVKWQVIDRPMLTPEGEKSSVTPLSRFNDLL